MQALFYRDATTCARGFLRPSDSSSQNREGYGCDFGEQIHQGHGALAERSLARHQPQSSASSKQHQPSRRELEEPSLSVGDLLTYRPSILRSAQSNPTAGRVVGHSICRRVRGCATTPPYSSDARPMYQPCAATEYSSLDPVATSWQLGLTIPPAVTSAPCGHGETVQIPLVRRRGNTTSAQRAASP
jgi:hypothetical protein